MAVDPANRHLSALPSLDDYTIYIYIYIYVLLLLFMACVLSVPAMKGKEGEIHLCADRLYFYAHE